MTAPAVRYSVQNLKIGRLGSPIFSSDNNLLSVVVTNTLGTPQRCSSLKSFDDRLNRSRSCDVYFDINKSLALVVGIQDLKEVLHTVFDHQGES